MAGRYEFLTVSGIISLLISHSLEPETPVYVRGLDGSDRRGLSIEPVSKPGVGMALIIHVGKD